jgi:hypothetical protein
LSLAVDESSRRHTAAKALGIPSMPLSGKGECMIAKVAAMTWKRLSGRSGFTMCHSAILPLLIRNQSRSDWPEDFKGHDSSGVHASGDEKVKMATAAAVAQIGSLSFASIGSLNRLLRRAVL